MTDQLERTFVMVKPDGVRRGLVGKILARYEAKGLRIVALEQRQIDATLADQHYQEHVGKDFYPSLREFITSGPLVPMVLEGADAVEIVRTLNGATNGSKAAPGTIRGDFGIGSQQNLVHASDSLASAAREIALWFPNLAG